MSVYVYWRLWVKGLTIVESGSYLKRDTPFSFVLLGLLEVVVTSVDVSNGHS